MLHSYTIAISVCSLLIHLLVSLLFLLPSSCPSCVSTCLHLRVCMFAMTAAVLSQMCYHHMLPCTPPTIYQRRDKSIPINQPNRP